MFEEFAQNITPSSIKTLKADLAALIRYLNWYSSRHRQIVSTADVDGHFTHTIYDFVQDQKLGEDAGVRIVRFMKRFLTAIGVAPELLPPTIGSPRPQVHDTIDDAEARRLLNRCKKEMGIVRRRVREGHLLAAGGKSPLRQHGGCGSWEDARDRAWVIKRHLHRRFVFGEALRAEGQRGVLAGFEGREGAEVLSKDDLAIRATGYLGHIRWYFPTSDDLAPFFVTIMLRTGWNMTTVANLRSRAWSEPYPFRLQKYGKGEKTAETHVFVVSYKTRGRRDTLHSAEVDRVASSRRPQSHPYRVLAFVDYMTAPIRRAVKNEIAELQQTHELTEFQTAELERLTALQDDLFLYRDQGRIRSVRALMIAGGTFAAARRMLLRAGVTVEPRRLRDAPILHAYATSGENLFVAQLVANHKDRKTTTLYLRRQRTLRRMWDQATAVFGASLQLAESGNLDIASIRAVMRAQTVAGRSLTEQQIDNVLDPATRSRWGNRCADPLNPPEGFDVDAGSSGCRTQDCIDGCPYARWFDDSVDHIARQMVIAENIFALVGLESTEASSLESRIERCRLLLSRWPRETVDEAIARARETATSDVFLGAAL